MRTSALALLTVALLTSGNVIGQTPQAGGTLPTGPAAGDQDISPFYRWTGARPTRPGALLRQEAMPVDLTPPHAVEALRILYSSTDGRWNSGLVPVSGALYLPKGVAPKGGWPLIAWAHGTLGVADSCAPSWTGSNPRDRAYIDGWLAKGYAVVAPDYQGLGGPGPHAYTIWQSEGRSVLDAARVALRMGKPIAHEVVITGQSQGSGASLGAARLAASYAPDLPVKGAIATALLSLIEEPGQPADTKMPGGHPYYLIYRMIGGGLPDGSPPVDSFLTDKGKLLLDAARVQCQPRVVAEKEGITLDNAFTVPAAQIEAKLGPAGGMSPFRASFPMMIGTGLADELISADRQEKAVRALCRAGNHIGWKRYPTAKHSDTLTQSFDDAEAFARAVVAGDLPPNDCGSL